jgi:uncharacterized glyoxalase superfamily protein PhnB
MVSYEDVAAMADWMVRAFGFVEAIRLTDATGTVTHIELRYADGAVMLGNPGPAYQSPTTHRRTCTQADTWLQTPYVVDGVLVRVRDIDAHFLMARESGATILSTPEDAGPGRLYRAADPEGHRWMFLQSSDD